MNYKMQSCPDGLGLENQMNSTLRHILAPKKQIRDHAIQGLTQFVQWELRADCGCDGINEDYCDASHHVLVVVIVQLFS